MVKEWEIELTAMLQQFLEWWRRAQLAAASRGFRDARLAGDRESDSSEYSGGRAVLFVLSIRTCSARNGANCSESTCCRNHMGGDRPRTNR